jgi:hypothetical protein
VADIQNKKPRNGIAQEMAEMVPAISATGTT